MHVLTRAFVEKMAGTFWGHRAFRIMLESEEGMSLLRKGEQMLRFREEDRQAVMDLVKNPPCLNPDYGGLAAIVKVTHEALLANEAEHAQKQREYLHRVCREHGLWIWWLEFQLPP